jgi:hypothetical protein
MNSKPQITKNKQISMTKLRITKQKPAPGTHAWSLVLVTCLLFVICCLVLSARAEEKKPDPKNDKPRIVVSLPLGVAAGAPAKVTLRGLKLDTATEVRCTDEHVTVKVLSKGKAAVPDKLDAAKVGDTQIEIELNAPAELAGKAVGLAAVTPAGDSETYEVLIDEPGKVILEKEPNNGFRQAQAIAVPQVIEGFINPAQDVDVYRFEGKSGQTVVLEVVAARRGSALDSLLMLHDGDGKLLATNDDHGSSTDSYLEVKLPRDGRYFVSVLDALDTGGPVHVYRLIVKAK